MPGPENRLEARKPTNPETIALATLSWIKGLSKEDTDKTRSLLNHVRNVVKERTRNAGEYQKLSEDVIDNIAEKLALSTRERLERGFSVELSVLFALDTANIRNDMDRRELKTQILLQLGRIEAAETRRITQQLEKQRKKLADLMTPGEARHTKVSKTDEFYGRVAGWRRHDDQLPEDDK